MVAACPNAWLKGFEIAEQFKSELTKFPGISSVCAASHDFANGTWLNIGFTDDNGTYRTFNMNVIDDDYINVMNMKLAQGKKFFQIAMPQTGDDPSW